MSILFQNDWTDENGKPRAIPHMNTKNESFLRTCALLKKLGIKNYAFPLALYDPDLKDVDPHDLEENTYENEILRTKVQTESRRNIWYFVREVARIYNQGGPPVKFRLNRGSLAMLWCFFNSIDYATLQPRQAQPLYSKILTPNGFSRMGDMTVGSEIIAADGSIANVLGIYPQGFVKTFKVTFEDGRSTECSDRHLWKTSTSRKYNDVWDVKSLMEIQEYLLANKNKKIYVPLLDPSDNDDINLPMDPDVLGLQLNNGHDLSDDVLDCYLHASTRQKLNLLMNLIGDVPLPDSRYKYITQSENIADKLQQIIWSLGGRCTLDITDSGYQLHLDPFPSDRRLRITNIEYLGEAESQCIEISHSDELYITDNYIVSRNTGKTVGALTIYVWLLFCGGNDSQIGHMAKDNKLREDNVARIKRISECLPSWWIAVDKNNDKSNATAIKYTALQTELATVVAQDNPVEADKQGRGGTMPVYWWDEFEFCQNIGISYSTIIASGGAARANAKMNGKPYSNIITTTAGDPINPACREAAKILDGAMPFTESLYDLTDNKELHEVVANNSPQKMIIGIFSHNQLGLSNDWLRDEIRKAKMSPDKVMREYLNRRVTLQDKPVIPAATLALINSSQTETKWLQILESGFVIRWYLHKEVVTSQTFKNRPIIVGCDSSEMIGKDSTTLVGVDPSTLEVVFTFRSNIGNVGIVGVRLAKLLMMYPKMVFVPENKSTGTSLIDIVSLMLRKENHNPFIRIFNWVVNNRDDPNFAKINIKDMSLLDTPIKKYFGIKTSKESRTELYSDILLEATQLCASRIRDQMLIQELNGLTERNGRVDHATGQNDDTVIAFLLALFFILRGKHLHIYGIAKHEIMKSVASVGEDKERLLREKQEKILNKIEELEELLKYQKDPSVKRMLEGDIEMFKNMIDPNIGNTPRFSDELYKDPRKFVDAKIAEESRPKIDTEEMINSMRALMRL